MATIVTRAGKASPLTNQELDSNFNNLNTGKAELSGAVFTGAITTNSTFDGRDVATDGTKLDGIEASATADQTGAQIKTAYEAQTNAFTDAQFTKLGGIEASATADQTAAEIRALVESATDSNVFTDADHTKLNGVEASADVTANAGALMDSELTAIASVKALNQGVATGDSPTFAGLTATTADINGGTIDGTVIGGATPAAISGTTGQFGTSLNVDGTATVDGLTVAGDLTIEDNSPFINISNTGENAGGIKMYDSGGAATQYFNLTYDSGASNTVGFDTGASGEYTFSVNTVEKMRIESSGTIISTMGSGIFFKNSSGGTNSTQIQISNTGGDMRAGVESSAGNTIQSGTSAYAAVFGNQGNYPTQFTTNGTTRMTIDSSGNVGIGVTPEAWHSVFKALQIGTGSSIAGESGGVSTWFNTNAYYDGSWKYVTTNTALQIAHTSDGKQQFKVAASGSADSAISWNTAMTIDNSGNVHINSSSLTPNFTPKLFVAQTGAEVFLELKTSSTSAFGAVKFRNGNGDVGSISMFSTSVGYNTTSDYRLKENVVPMTGSIDRVKALKPSRFNFIVDADKTVDGFLAHEAQAVVPECATGTKDAMRDEEYEVTAAVYEDVTTPAVEAVDAVVDEDGVVITEAVEAQEATTESVLTTEAVMGTRSVPDMQGIDQAKLVPLLTAALQEAIARIEILEAGA